MKHKCCSSVARRYTRRVAVADPLLAAAARAFERWGYDDATLERIAQEAGLSRVTLHRRGVTKEGLLSQLAEQATAAYREALWPALTAPGTARDRLETALSALCASAEENIALLVTLGGRSDRIFHEEEGEEVLTRNAFTEPLERLLRDGAADGSLRDANAIEMATVLFNTVGWAYIHLRSGHGWKPDRARESVMGLVLDGLSPA